MLTYRITYRMGLPGGPARPKSRVDYCSQLEHQLQNRVTVTAAAADVELSTKDSPLPATGGWYVNYVSI
jgi:hypothetical protein